MIKKTVAFAAVFLDCSEIKCQKLLQNQEKWDIIDTAFRKIENAKAGGYAIRNSIGIVSKLDDFEIYGKEEDAIWSI